jgi:hypothetical protein
MAATAHVRRIAASQVISMCLTLARQAVGANGTQVQRPGGLVVCASSGETERRLRRLEGESVCLVAHCYPAPLGNSSQLLGDPKRAPLPEARVPPNGA